VYAGRERRINSKIAGLRPISEMTSSYPSGFAEFLLLTTKIVGVC